ncbi:MULTISPECIES: PIN domain-containing protein [unclassified Streptomyces]|uniref:PIN domain-containing protein n=1 Tax=unclassified Streptomyces TaxID=2593676 RepID=UPI0001D05AF1|nr:MULTISPECIES: PIN domain-containing protein [unclassified Streptomyces]EFF93203.1 PIN family toxin-antitoxin system, toxin component [Streptomyces sp. e14]MYX44614.1 PIN domain-containing protein [Streptomyces sp. SID89]NMO32472.1 PIN domain nuclease [Streptomyces sp. GMY02]
MNGYLLDTSALWYLFRTPGALEPWEGHIGAGAFHVCEPTRTEFLYSATGPAHRDDLAGELDTLCALAAVPKSAWRWVDTAQYKLTQKGQHRSAGAIDLLVCATAAHHDLTVLHLDDDFGTVARVLPELREQNVRDR